MWMGTKYRGGILGQRQLHDFAGMDTGAINGSTEKLHEFNQAMSSVKQQDAKDFMLEAPKPETQKVLDQLRR